MKQGKRLKAAYAAVDTAKSYPLDEAIRLIKANAKAKFDETVELSLPESAVSPDWFYCARTTISSGC